MTKYANFTSAFYNLDKAFRMKAQPVHTERWQGTDIGSRPEAKMMELLYETLDVSLESEDLDYFAASILPNLPWADNHFLERVGGEPLNPGVEWKNWPWANSADGHRDENGQFNHSYMARYWPRLAGLTDRGELRGTRFDPEYAGEETATRALDNFQHRGIRYRYGDLNDLVEQLHQEPLTRQAYLPIFFPEDTGVANPSRKPCTLGYLFLMRNDRLDITYYIRSCDYMRHCRDDVYMTVRLLLWVLQQLRLKDARWKSVKPGRFRMDIGSLHLFINDYRQLFGGRP